VPLKLTVKKESINRFSLFGGLGESSTNLVSVYLALTPIYCVNPKKCIQSNASKRINFIFISIDLIVDNHFKLPLLSGRGWGGLHTKKASDDCGYHHKEHAGPEPGSSNFAGIRVTAVPF